LMVKQETKQPKRTALVLLAEMPAGVRARRGHSSTDEPCSPSDEQTDLFVERYRTRTDNPQQDFDFLELVIADGFSIGRAMKFNVRRVSPRTFFGRGQAVEITQAVRALQPTNVVTNALLSPVHQRNLEEEWDIPIMTRADVIFDIFEQNATTSEGRIQVDLARLNYELPRVVGVGKELSRTGGDRGTRGGGGEPLTVLTKDYIRKRIRRLENEMEKVKRTRALRRKKRVRSGVFTIGLIGYTNSGKSSLINTLTRSEEEVAPRYFTTLEPAARRIYLGDNIKAVVTDTVGLLDDLPEELTTAFGATMEEAAESDLLLHIVDVSRDNVEFRIESGVRILSEFGLSGIPRIVIFNKIDLLDDFSVLAVLQEEYSPGVALSTVTGEGLLELTSLIRDRVSARRGTRIRRRHNVKKSPR